MIYIQANGDVTKKDEDIINQPSHYANGTDNFECIDMMTAVFGREHMQYYCLQTAFKYIWRMGNKDSLEDDARKAEWFLKRYKTYIMGEEKKQLKSIYDVLHDTLEHKAGDFLLDL